MKVNSVNIVLYDAKKRFLLQHRNLKAKTMPGFWAFFGGGLREGESPEEALSRETFEELNYQLKKPEFVLERDFTLEALEGHLRIYVEEYLGDKKLLKLKEGHSWGWFTFEESQGLKITPHDRQILKEILTYVEREGS